MLYFHAVSPRYAAGFVPHSLAIKKTAVTNMVSIPVPGDLEQVLQPMLERGPDKSGELLKAGLEVRLTELYQQWQAWRISTSRFAELLGVSPWELADVLRARGLKAP